MAIAIDDDVPIPQRYIYPFGDIDVGQSFFVAGENRLNGSITWARRKYLDRKFATHKVIESGVVGIRVWRIE